MEQQKKKKRAVAFGLVAVVLIFWNLMQNTADQQKLKVACIGDELTFGTAVEEREDNCYPVQLQKYMEQAEKNIGSVISVWKVLRFRKRVKSRIQRKNAMRAVRNIKPVLLL